MEPVSFLSSIVSAAEAAEAIRKLLGNADDLAKDDARYYAMYLAVAAKAVEGLEGEYLGILKQAAGCDLENATEVKALQDRIRDYIHGEVLRPSLNGAIERLREGGDALQDHAERLLIWSKVKKKRATALEKFDQLLNDLEGYLGSLGNYQGPSAVALDEIRRIQAELAREPLDADAFAEMVDDLLMNLDKSTLISTTGNCGRVIEMLRIAFR
jgi:hypothetical protein